MEERSDLLLKGMFVILMAFLKTDGQVKPNGTALISGKP